AQSIEYSISFSADGNTYDTVARSADIAYRKILGRSRACSETGERMRASLKERTSPTRRTQRPKTNIRIFPNGFLNGFRLNAPGKRRCEHLRKQWRVTFVIQCCCWSASNDYMAKVLVTGGAGFVGYHLAKRLASQSHDVTLADNFFRGQRDEDLE